MKDPGNEIELKTVIAICKRKSGERGNVFASAGCHLLSELSRRALF